MLRSSGQHRQEEFYSEQDIEEFNSFCLTGNHSGEELRRGHDHEELGDILGDEHELQRDRQPRLLLPVPGAGGHPGGELAGARHRVWPHRAGR